MLRQCPLRVPSAAATGCVLKNVTKFTGKTCAGVSFLIKLQALGLKLY